MSDIPVSSNIVGSDERILWQGRPQVRLDLPMLLSGNLSQMWVGLFMAAFALFWIIQTTRDGAPVMFPLFGLLFLGQGLVTLAKPVIWPLFLRSRSYYTLTDKHAYVVTDVPGKGRRITSTPIGNHVPVEWVDSNPPSLIFGAAGMTDRLAFHNIDEADRVMRLIRDIQSDGQSAANSASAYGGEWQGEEWGWQEHGGTGDAIDVAASNIPQVDAARRGGAPATPPADAPRAGDDGQAEAEQPPPLPQNNQR